MLLWVLAQCGYQYYFSWMLLGFHSIVEDLRTRLLFIFRSQFRCNGFCIAGVWPLLRVAACGGPECVFEP